MTFTPSKSAHPLICAKLDQQMMWASSSLHSHSLLSYSYHHCVHALHVIVDIIKNMVIMSFLKQLNVLAYNRYLLFHPIQFLQQVCSITVYLLYNVRPKPLLNKFFHSTMLIVQTTIIYQHPTTIFNKFRTQSVFMIKLVLVFFPSFFQPLNSNVNILRSSFKLPNL